MKQTILFSFLILVGLSACKTENSKNESLETTTAQKKASTKEKVGSETTKTSIDYSFDLYSALGYKIGDNTKQNPYPKELFLKMGEDKYMDEGETWKVPKTIVSDEDGVLIDLVHEEDSKTNASIDSTEEIVIHSEKLKNEEGIGVGSTLLEFTKAYPYSIINYSYINDKIWIKNAAEGYFFYFDLPENLNKKIEINSDLMEIPFDLVDENSKIRSIKIYGRKNTPDHMANFKGNWKGKTKAESNPDIEVKIYEKNKAVFADITTGEEVYQQFTEQLISNNDLYTSTPTSKRKIKIEQVNPMQLSLFLDDNPEFDPIRITLSNADKEEKSINANELPLTISSMCYVLHFEEERGRLFVDVQFIDLVENNENGFNIIEKDKRTFELVKEKFMSCRGKLISLPEIQSKWNQLQKDDRQWYHITVENGSVTEFYLEDCAG